MESLRPVTGGFFYILAEDRVAQMPVAFNNQIITKIITTTFKMVLYGCCIGKYELMSQSKTPTTTSTISMTSIDIAFMFWE